MLRIYRGGRGTTFLNASGLGSSIVPMENEGIGFSAGTAELRFADASGLGSSIAPMENEGIGFTVGAPGRSRAGTARAGAELRFANASGLPRVARTAAGDPDGRGKFI